MTLAESAESLQLVSFLTLQLFRFKISSGVDQKKSAVMIYRGQGLSFQLCGDYFLPLVSLGRHD